MNEVALISDHTYRTRETQKQRYPDIPHFILPDDMSVLFRKTRRKTGRVFRVVSFGIIGQNEVFIKEFAELCKKEGSEISSYDDAFTWLPENPASLLVSLWRSARVMGSAKIGGQISADKKKAKAALDIAKIAERWPLPSSEWSTADLLQEAGVSLNTAKNHLGKRPIAQYNYQAAQKRKERRNALVKK